MKDFQEQDIITVGSDGNINTWKVSKEDGVTTLHLKFETNPKFFKTITYGDGVATINFNHGIGRGTVIIPSGEMYDLLEAFNIIDKLKIEDFSASRIFKEELK